MDNPFNELNEGKTQKPSEVQPTTIFDNPTIETPAIEQPTTPNSGETIMQNQQGGQPQFGGQNAPTNVPTNAPTFGGGTEQPFGGGQQQFGGNQQFGGGQQQFGGNQQFGGGQQQFGGNQPQQPKYHIIDMLWMINQKIIKKEQLQPNERHLLSVGINASFGNMRMSFYDATNNVFTPSSIIIANATRKTVANAYPEACNEVLANKDSGKTIFLFERVIRADNRWTPNQTGITWTPNKITIQSIDSQNNQSIFNIVDWQVEAFEKALRFMTTGGGWLASLQGTINR